MIVRRALAMIALATLAACGSASDSVTFQAPPGFTQAASIGPFVQVWNTADKQSLITLMALPVKMDLNKTINQASISDAKVTLKRNIKICGDQLAIFADIIGESKSAAPGVTPSKKHIEFLATDANDKTYVTMYMRPVAAAADPAAEAAIQKICPKS
jgi:hypothetical protein